MNNLPHESTSGLICGHSFVFILRQSSVEIVKEVKSLSNLIETIVFFISDVSILSINATITLNT